MKKILMLVLLLCFAIPISAQWEPVKQGTSGYGQYIYMQKGDTLAQFVYFAKDTIYTATTIPTSVTYDTLTVTTTAQQLPAHSSYEFDLVNEGDYNVYYSNAQTGIYRMLSPMTAHNKFLDNTDNYWVKTKSGTVLLIIEVRK